MMPARSLVPISGCGCITAAGATLRESLQRLDDGSVTPHAPTFFAPDVPHPVFECILPDTLAAWEDVLALSGNAAEVMQASRTVQLAAVAAEQALCNAGITKEYLTAHRVGVCLGTSVGASLHFFSYYKDLCAHQENDLQEIISYLQSNPAPALARFYGASGPVQTVTNACSSGTDALGIAAQWIRNDWCDIVIAGGADALVYITYLGFQSLKLTSQAPCKPFDVERAGLNLGEGAGIMILESHTSLAKRKMPVLGSIAGYGTCGDAYHLTAPHPQAVGLKKALQQACAQADCALQDVSFMNAHGTATKTNDAAEAAFFHEMCPDIPFIATKGATGHTLGAAGAIEALFTLAHLKRGKLPATPGFALSDPAMAVYPVCKPTFVAGDFAASHSLAFGGNNSVLVLKKGEQPCAWL